MLRPYDKLVRMHYAKIAKSFGESSKSTMPDVYIREQEYLFVEKCLKHIHRNEKVLDVGCGNGNLISKLAPIFPECFFQGEDFSADLIKIAQQRNLARSEFLERDARERETSKFDVIICERVLINILQRSDQWLALENIYHRLNPKGMLILIESFDEPMVNLNHALSEFQMDPFEVPQHNYYLNEVFIDRMIKLGFKESTLSSEKHFLSTHFYMTRVFHPLLRVRGDKVKYTEFIKFFDEALPSGIGEYSPIQFRRFIKD